MIQFYVGNLGSGKTLNMVKDVVDLLKRGRFVISNTPIQIQHNGKTLKALFISNGEQFEKAIINYQNATFAWDETGVALPAQFWAKLPMEYIMKFAQSRHFGCDFLCTSQDFSHTVKRLRDLANFVWLCSSHRYLGVFNRVFTATQFYPSFFYRHISDPKRIAQMIVDRRTIYPSEQRRLFEAYSTKYVVDFSAMGKMKKFDMAKLAEFNRQALDELHHGYKKTIGVESGIQATGQQPYLQSASSVEPEANTVN